MSLFNSAKVVLLSALIFEFDYKGKSFPSLAFLNGFVLLKKAFDFAHIVFQKYLSFFIKDYNTFRVYL